MSIQISSLQIFFPTVMWTGREHHPLARYGGRFQAYPEGAPSGSSTSVVIFISRDEWLKDKDYFLGTWINRNYGWEL